MHIVDRAELDRLAATLERHAEHLRTAARRLSAAAERARWRSPAAAAFALQSRSLVDSALTAADRLATAAATLRVHARTAERAADAMDVSHDVTGAARSLGHALGGLLP